MNEPVPDSVFGTMVNNCADTFCRDKDGLELWLNLVNECFTTTIMMNEKYNKFIFYPLYTSIFCSSVGYLSFIMSYYITIKWLNY